MNCSGVYVRFVLIGGGGGEGGGSDRGSYLDEFYIGVPGGEAHWNMTYIYRQLSVLWLPV